MGFLQNQINRAMPAFAKAKVGDVLADLIAQVNKLVADAASVFAQLNTGIVVPAALAIKAGSSAVVKSTALIVYRANGTAVVKAANTDMAALVGTIADTKFASWAFYGDDAGALTASAKTADSATAIAALALLPAVPAGKVQLGTVTVQNASGAPFIGNTTALDAASVTATYANTAVAAIFSSGLTATTVVDLESRS